MQTEDGDAFRFAMPHKCPPAQVCPRCLSSWKWSRQEIRTPEGLAEAREKATAVADKLEHMKLPKAAEKIREGIEETLVYYNFPMEHRRHIWTNNPLERLMREVRRCSRVVGCFPDGNSALMLAAARLRHIAGTQ